jgi:O-antigen ligase
LTLGSIFLACLAFGVAALLIAAITLSLSCMGFISSVASLAFVAIVALARRFSGRRAFLLAACIALLAILLAVVLPTAPLIQRFGEIEKNGEDRSPAWRDTLNLIADYPLFGCGLGAYESAFLKYKRSAPANLQVVRQRSSRAACNFEASRSRRRT